MNPSYPTFQNRLAPEKRDCIIKISQKSKFINQLSQAMK